MEKRTVLAIVLCIGVWLIWASIFKIDPPPTKSPEVANQAAKTTTTKNEYQSDEKAPAERSAEEIAVIKNDLLEAQISSWGGGIKSLRIEKYKSKDRRERAELVKTESERDLPFQIDFRPENTSFKMPSFQDWEIGERNPSEVALRLKTSDLTIPRITKYFRLSEEDYQIDVLVKIENQTDRSVDEQIVLHIPSVHKPAVSTGCFSQTTFPSTPACMIGDQVVPNASGCKSSATIEPGTERILEPNVLWTGIAEQYFLMAAVPVGVENSVCNISARPDNLIRSSLMYSKANLAPGAQIEHQFRVFTGPKQIAVMEKVQGGIDGKKKANLEASVDYGWFSALCHPMLWLLKKFYEVVGNYGVAIMLLTLVIKIILLPLNQKSMKSMGEMAKLKPLIEDLKKRCGDDKQKMNQEMMALYKAHKINPAAGCLPMLIQLPFWIALYKMLSLSVELYQEIFIPGWIVDLTDKDPYYIMPIALGIITFIQQKMTPTSADAQQQKMMLYFMPAFFTFIMLSLPSGLVLYIFVNSILSIAHQQVYNRMTRPKQAT